MHTPPIATSLVASILLVACASGPPAGGASAPGAAGGTASTTSAAGIPPGMNAAGEVVDASKVEGGRGRKVKGLNDTDGEITGKPLPGSKFTKVEIGMGLQQVIDLVGPPNDRGEYITGKSFIPFYFGGDRSREELAYKGQGRLVFSSASFGDMSSRLIWIIHSANESGYR